MSQTNTNKTIKINTESEAIKFFSKNLGSIASYTQLSTGQYCFIMKHGYHEILTKFPELVTAKCRTWYGTSIANVNAYARNAKNCGEGYGQSRMRFATVSKNGKYCKWVRALQLADESPRTRKEILEIINKNTKIRGNDVKIYSNKDVLNAMQSAGFIDWEFGNGSAIVEVTPTGKQVLAIIEGSDN